MNYQHIRRSADYNNLSTYGFVAALSHQSDQATLSLSPWDRALGSFSIGYFDIKAEDNSHTRLMNLSWSRSLWQSSSLNLSVNRDLQDNSYASMLQIIIPFDSQSSVQLSGQRSSSGQWGENINVSRSAPAEGGLGWNLAHSIGGNNYSQADLTWINRVSTLSGGYYGSRDDHHSWFEAAGSVVLMDNSLFFARQINDAFIVVSTGNYPNIAVNYENRKVGVTDKNGHLLIPWASAWYPGKVTLDTLPLPTDTEAVTVENASPYAKAAARWLISRLTACARQRSSSSMLRDNRYRSVRRWRKLIVNSAPWWATTAWSGSRTSGALTKSK